jgi:hypothetical protein
MTSYEGLGAEHAETTEALINGILRKEWNFKGAITTDYISNYSVTNGATNALQMFVRVGGSLGMGASIGTADRSSSPRYLNRLKEISKEILWTWLRAEYNAIYYTEHPDANDTYEYTSTLNPWVWWKPMLYTFNTAVIAGVVIWAEAVVLNRVFKLKKKEAEVDTEPTNGDGGKK